MFFTDEQLTHLLRCAAADKRVATFFFGTPDGKISLGDVLTAAIERIGNSTPDLFEQPSKSNYDNFKLTSGMQFLVDKPFTFKNTKFTQGDNIRYAIINDAQILMQNSDFIYRGPYPDEYEVIDSTIRDMLVSGHVTQLN